MSSYWTYLGNYGKSQPQGIHLARYDSAGPALVMAGLAGTAQDPNFVILHPSKPVLYAVTGAKIADYPGAVEAFALDAAIGKLTLLSRQPSGGNNPCHLAIDHNAQCLTVANYSGGTIALLPLGPDGQLSPPSQIIQHHGSSENPSRQSKPHPHQTVFHPTEQVLLVPDLGMDQVLRYKLEHNTLTPDGFAAVPPGSGPRHITFSTDLRFLYVINELKPSISVIAYSASGPMHEIQHLTPWPENPAYAGAEIELHPDGRFLYASNRGHDTIAVCSVDPFTGKLTLVDLTPTGGKTPRHFGLDPGAQFLLASNMDSDSIVLFRVSRDTGRLTPLSPPVATEAPCCTAFFPISS